MGEILALLRFDGLDAAGIIGLEHDASPILSVDERKTASVALQVAERIDKIHLCHTQKLSDGCDVRIREADIPLPAAAGAAALAGVNDGGSICHISGVSPRACGLLS